MYAWRENQSEAALQPTSPLSLAFPRECVIMSRSADESLHVLSRLHLCKPTEKYVCTPLAVLLSGCRLRGADLLQLAIGEEDFHSRGGKGRVNAGYSSEADCSHFSEISFSFSDFTLDAVGASSYVITDDSPTLWNDTTRLSFML